MIKNTHYIVVLASDKQLGDQNYRRRLKDAVRLSGIPQRAWRNVIQDSFLYADLIGIIFVFPDVVPYPVPMVDEVWIRNPRYIREFLQSRRSSHLERDRMIDAYFRIWAFVFSQVAQ